ncbi:MAG: DUF4159 domain-containing protein [Chthonomonas sp.]|nr:DUF4159 domain-containing protein [Chthonomonas sp.]
MTTKSALLLVTAALAANAVSAPVTFSGRRLPVNVGVLVIESQTTGGEPTNLAPHVWGQLEKDRAIKPAAWSFTNPRANSSLTDFMQTRWVNRGVANVPSSGSRMTKDDGPYWEVDLDDASDTQLANYDALLLVVSGTVSLNSKEREKLRKFIDQGGLLWVDVAAGGSPAFDVTNPLPIPMLFNFSATSLLIDPTHQLVSYPNAITPSELGSLFSAGTGVIQVPNAAPGNDSQGWVLVDGLKLDPVVGPDPTAMTLGLAKIGDGYMMATTRFVSGALNQGRNGAGAIVANTGFRSFPPVQSNVFSSAAKLVINALSLRASSSTGLANGRHTNSLSVDISAPLLKRFETAQISPAADTSPVLYKNRIVMLGRDGRLYVLDARASDDLDGDSNPDDGYTDAAGSPIDIIWRSAPLVGGGRGSTPTCTELVRSVDTADGSDAILVHVAEAGQPSTVYQFPFRGSGDNFPESNRYTSDSNTTLTPASGFTVPQKAPASPTVHEGIAYVADITEANNALGRVWAIDLMDQVEMQTASRQWQIQLAPRMAAVDGAPTVGYIPIQDNSGGADKVVYVPTQPDAARSAGFVSIWAGVRGEAPVSVQRIGNTLQITTRASLQNLPIYASGGTGQQSLDLKLTVLDTATGRPFSGANMNNMFAGSPLANSGQNGTIRIDLGGFGQGLDFTGPNPTAALRIDYTLDWGRAGSGPGLAAADNYIRGDAQLPDDSGNGRRVLGTVALGSTGNIFVVTAPSDVTRPGGSLFALKERGRGDFNMLYRWEAFDQMNLLASASTGLTRIPYDGCVVDHDGLLNFPGIGAFLNRPMTIQRFATGPVVRGNRVYAALNSGKQFPFPTGSERFNTSVIAFEADPRPLEMLVEGLGQSFALVQPDPGRSIRPAVGPFEPNVLSVLQPIQFQTDTVNGFSRVTLNSVASVSRGRFRDALICNLPVIARRGGSPDMVIQPDAGVGDGLLVPGNADGRWNPQKWQIVINGMETTGNMFVSGDTLYFGGGSFLPGFLENGFGTLPTKTGFLYAVDLRIGANDLREPSIRHAWQVGPLRGWERYISLIDPDPSGNGVTPSPYVIWPSNNGIRSFDDFRVRVRQAVLGSPSAPSPLSGIIGGNDALLAWNNNETFAFSRSDLLVTDESRIIRIDPSGAPLWSVDATLKGGQDGEIGSSQTSVNLSRPTRAYSVGGNSYLIADPGNNRIVKIDGSGRELRTLTKFNLDPIYLPEGVPANAPTKLAGPRDVLTFTTFQSDIQINQMVSNGELSPALARRLNGTAEYWVHYVIADTGNQRVIELIDRYEYSSTRGVIGPVARIDDPSSDAPITTVAGIPRRLVPALGMLKWQIKSELTRKQYSYNSIDRIWLNDSHGSHPIFAFGFGNVEPAQSSFGLPDTGRTDNQVGAGGVVLYDPDHDDTAVITSFNVPPISSSVFWNDTTANWGINDVQNTYVGGGMRKISGLRSATLGYVNGVLSVMISDSNGVYELTDNAGTWDARWAMPREAYVVMRRGRLNPSNPNPVVPTTKNPMGFIPTFARRLNSGEILVVNGYVGKHRVASLPHVSSFGISPGDPFGGEVVVLDGAIDPNPANRGFGWNKPNLGFDSYYVNFELPPVAGTRSLEGPVFAEKR